MGFAPNSDWTGVPCPSCGGDRIDPKCECCLARADSLSLSHRARSRALDDAMSGSIRTAIAITARQRYPHRLRCAGVPGNMNIKHRAPQIKRSISPSESSTSKDLLADPACERCGLFPFTIEVNRSSPSPRSGIRSLKDPAITRFSPASPKSGTDASPRSCLSPTAAKLGRRRHCIACAAEAFTDPFPHALALGLPAAVLQRSLLVLIRRCAAASCPSSSRARHTSTPVTNPSGSPTRTTQHHQLGVIVFGGIKHWLR